jgi:hypothetical protein
MEEILKTEYKVYVDVLELHAKDGLITPLGFIWEDGRNYLVDGVVDIRKAASLKAGGIGLRYTVKIGGSVKFMFLEEDSGVRRWFMERK